MSLSESTRVATASHGRRSCSPADNSSRSISQLAASLRGDPASLYRLNARRFIDHRIDLGFIRRSDRSLAGIFCAALGPMDRDSFSGL